MSGQGFPSEGNDRRLFSWFAPLCRKLSWKSDRQPPSVIVSGLSVKIYLPLWWKKRADFPNLHKFLMIRAGWHYDADAHEYILGLARKVTDSASLY